MNQPVSSERRNTSVSNCNWPWNTSIKCIRLDSNQWYTARTRYKAIKWRMSRPWIQFAKWRSDALFRFCGYNEIHIFIDCICISPLPDIAANREDRRPSPRLPRTPDCGAITALLSGMATCWKFMVKNKPPFMHSTVNSCTHTYTHKRAMHLHACTYIHTRVNIIRGPVCI